MIACKASNPNHGALSPLHPPKRPLKHAPIYRICHTPHTTTTTTNTNNNLCVVFSSLADGPRWNQYHQFTNGGTRNGSSTVYKKPRNAEEAGEEGGGGERKVQCEVELISWRERRIKADILVNADIDSVWNALTDYERLADFIPNLVSRY